jgi:hypothetical protein
VNVTVGLRNAGYVEIRSGLKEGEQVIYAGYESLREGDPVVPTAWGPQGLVSLPPATGAEQAAPGTIYTCPMHPEVRMDRPGNCPKCGMKLQPVKNSGGTAAPAPSAGTARAASGATYYCPMHPEVQSDKPGKCPKCGMDLVVKPKGGRGAEMTSGGAR